MKSVDIIEYIYFEVYIYNDNEDYHIQNIILNPDKAPLNFMGYYIEYVIGDDIIIHKYWLDIDIYHQYISSEIGYPTIISEFIREVIFILDK